MDVDVVGGIKTVALISLFALFITEAVKQIFKRWVEEVDFEKYWCLIPIPLAVLCTGVGIGLAALQAPGFEEMNLVAGGAAGFVAAALAAYGHDILSGIVKGVTK